MATIYRFIVEQKQSGGGSGGRKSNKESSGANPKTPSKKGKWVSALSSPKGGVEHNRKFRAINPLLNRATGGWWEKGTRLGRAGLGLVQTNTATGATRLSPVALAIIASFLIQMLLKWQARERERADRANYRDFKNLENGVGAIHGQYEISVNFWNGRRTYNENK